MCNRKKVIIVILFFLFVLTLTGCYKKDRYIFTDSVFEYCGEPVLFYEELFIEEITVTFEEITQEVFDSSANINVLKNFYDSKCYKVIFLLKYSFEEMGQEYSFEYLGKSGDRSDGYKILLNINSEAAGVEGNLTMIWQFLGKIGGDVDLGDNAGRICLSIMSNEINDVVNNDNFISFPVMLYLIEEEK